MYLVMVTRTISSLERRCGNRLLGRKEFLLYLHDNEEHEEAPVTLLFYKRFIDDDFAVWTGSETELKQFAAYANMIHDSIEVEFRYDRKWIFLDTLV